MRADAVAKHATCIILDDGDAGTFGFSPTAYADMEPPSRSWIRLTVTRTNRAEPSGHLVVVYSTVAGTAEPGEDFTGVLSGTLAFSDGQHTGVLDIEVLGDDNFEVRALAVRIISRTSALHSRHSLLSLTSVSRRALPSEYQ